MCVRILCLIAISMSIFASPVRAQWAVVDAPAMIQLLQQVQIMEQELQTTREQLSQAKQALQSMTGDRGMEWLLSGTLRNYLPSSWPQLMGAIQGGGAYPALSSDVRNAMAANAVLSAQQLMLLSSADQQRIVAGRQSSALQEAVSQEALANSSGRFASLQSLIAAISTASDPKSILDLQARISAELGMLQNEQTKLQILNQATLAQSAVNAQQERELVVVEQGSFETRFQPAP